MKSQKQSSRNLQKVSLRPPSSQSSNRMSKSNLSPKADNSYDLDLNNERASSFVRKSTFRSTLSSAHKMTRRSTNRLFSVGALIQIYKDEQYLPGIVKRVNSDKSYAIQYLDHGLRKMDPYVLRKDLIERDKFEAYQFEYPPLRVGDFVDSLHIYLKGQITKIHQDSNTYRITNQYGSVKDHIPRHLIYKYDENKSQYDSECDSTNDNNPNTIHFINNAVSTLNSIEEGKGEYGSNGSNNDSEFEYGITPISSTCSSKPTTAEVSKPEESKTEVSTTEDSKAEESTTLESTTLESTTQESKPEESTTMESSTVQSTTVESTTTESKTENQEEKKE